ALHAYRQSPSDTAEQASQYYPSFSSARSSLLLHSLPLLPRSELPVFSQEEDMVAVILFSITWLMIKMAFQKVYEARLRNSNATIRAFAISPLAGVLDGLGLGLWVGSIRISSELISNMPVFEALTLNDLGIMPHKVKGFPIKFLIQYRKGGQTMVLRSNRGHVRSKMLKEKPLKVVNDGFDGIQIKVMM
nr:NADH dehydrogenase [ubiquinone] 1 alpha subcomplex subunit 9, mitochondrial [Tanacetum cinerariifolium]